MNVQMASQLYLLWGIVIVFCGALIAGLGYLLGVRRSRRIHYRRIEEDRAEMLTIERALKRFWDHEKQALLEEAEELRRRIEFLEGKLDQYRRRAAGVGMMGLGKGKRTDMLISLLLENEALEEKLFLQNWKLKQELDEHLERELHHISYKRILLSEIVKQENVRREIERFLRSGSNIRRLEALASGSEPEQAAGEGRGIAAE